MNVLDIYSQYRIPPFLQLHQLRVAAVAKSISSHFDTPLDERVITIACLFHDMGNILKVDFSCFPEAFEPEGVAHWKKVQDDFVRRFGPDEHHATIAIAHELHLPLQAVRYIEGIGFSKIEQIRDMSSYEQKIVEYADCRVAPQSIVSMQDRFAESRERYRTRRTDITQDPDRYEQIVRAGGEMERQIFARCSIKPEDITEASAQSIIAAIREFQLG